MTGKFISCSTNKEYRQFDRSSESGPFDIIGDVHGCILELNELLTKLGYEFDQSKGAYRNKYGRRVVFVGDLVDRGTSSIETLNIARTMTLSGDAFAVPGNHDDKFLRWLQGRTVSLSNGLAETAKEIDAIPSCVRQEWIERIRCFLEGLPAYLILDGGKLIVAHAGILQQMIGKISPSIRDFCVFGAKTGTIGDDGRAERWDWATEYIGSATIVYGHTPQASPGWVNNTLNIDTGCVFGGALTALRWPEREIVSVRSTKPYANPARKFL